MTQVAGLDPTGLLLQRGDHFADSLACLLIRPSKVLSLVHSYVVNDFDGVFQIVESDHALNKNKKDLGHSQRIFFIVGNFMELFDGVIGHIPESAAEERRDTGHRDWPAAF